VSQFSVVATADNFVANTDRYSKYGTEFSRRYVRDLKKSKIYIPSSSAWYCQIHCQNL